MTDWTEPDHADEEWVQPWRGDWDAAMMGDWRQQKSVGPYYLMAEDDWLFDGRFFYPRARWVSDRD